MPGKILRLAHDSPLFKGVLQACLIAAGDHRQLIDLLVLSIALVRVRVEIADEGAFHNRFDGFFGVDIGFRQQESKASNAPRLEGPNCRSGQPAQLVGRECLCLASSQEQKSLSFKLGGRMQQRAFKNLSRSLARRDHITGDFVEGGICRLERDLRFILLASI